MEFQRTNPIKSSKLNPLSTSTPEQLKEKASWAHLKPKIFLKFPTLPTSICISDSPNFPSPIIAFPSGFKISLISSNTGKVLKSLGSRRTEMIRCVDVRGDGKLVAGGDETGWVGIWESQRGGGRREVLRAAKVHDRYVLVVALLHPSITI
jgi:hypothetical protein